MINIECNGQNFNVEMIKKRANKKIYLRVRNGVVLITTPVRLSTQQVYEMIAKNFNTIVKNMNMTEEIEDEIHLLGKLYRLTIISSPKNDLKIRDSEILIFSKNDPCTSFLLQKLYKRTLEEIVEAYAKNILSKFHIEAPVNFLYKNVKGYYGECFPKRKLIILSTKLAKYELKYILSVIYHECAHFKYQNHQKEFYDYLEERYPNYRCIQKELRKIKYYEKY